MLALDKQSNTIPATPGLSLTPRRVNLASFFEKVIPDTTFFSIISSSSHNKVPEPSLKEFRTRTFTLYCIANSTERVCKTFAPRDASSNISS